LASKSVDGTVRLWSIETGKELARTTEPMSEAWRDSGVAFHPVEPILATLSRKVGVIRTWQLNANALLRPEHQGRSVTITSAKIVLVGESNVGKSCLALRLAEDRYQEQGTTHGMRFWPISAEHLGPTWAGSPEEKREVVFWDMGGQDEYRLVHQLFLQD